MSFEQIGTEVTVESPVWPCRGEDLDVLEHRLGIVFPQDFRQLLTEWGIGVFSDWLWVCWPDPTPTDALMTTADPIGTFGVPEFAAEILEDHAAAGLFYHEAATGWVPPPHAPPERLVPWGRINGGEDTCYWLFGASLPPDIVLTYHEHPYMARRWSMNTTEVLLLALRNPDDFHASTDNDHHLTFRSFDRTLGPTQGTGSGGPVAESPDERIERARQTGAQSLDLSSAGLTEFPESVRELTNLTELNLGHNHLTELPPWLAELSALTVVKAGCNRLTGLPGSMAVMPRLTELHLFGNSMTELPAWICDLVTLRELRLGLNRLTALPDRIGELTNLERLSLFRNRLAALPDGLRLLRNLIDINLSNNPLGVLPDAVADLRSLHTLELRDIGLRTLPDWIGDLTNIGNLNLAQNCLSAVPATIGRLDRMYIFDVSENVLTSLPPVLATMNRLGDGLNTSGNPGLAR